MSRSFQRRVLTITLFFLLGAAVSWGIIAVWFAQLSEAFSFLISSSITLLVTLTGLFIDQRIALVRPETDRKDSDTRQLEASLLQLNRELEENARNQTSELARLNLELDLQIAMHRQAEEIARTNEVRFRNMADNIQEGLTIIENDRLVYVNERACDIFGECPEGDLIQRITKFALPKEVERLQPLLSGSSEGKDAEAGLPSELQYWISRPDGSQRCIREHYSTSTSAQTRRIFVVTFDVTERVQAVHTLEQAVNDRTRELSAVLEISKRIASTLELEPLLNLILDQIQAIIPYSGAAIFTLEDDSLQVISYMVPGLPSRDRPIWLSLTNAGYIQSVVQDRKVTIVDDVRGDTPLARAFQEVFPNQNVFHFSHARSWIGIPLVIRDRVTGLMSLANSEPGFYTQRHAHLAETITNQMAIAIENARLYEQAQNLATLEERNRIARELHDSVTQLLYGICLYSTATSRSIRNKNYSQVEQNLTEIKEDALQALQEMRLLILELNPPLLQKEGLVPALQASLDAIETRTGLETELRADGIGRLPRVVEPELYRIAMEALNNLVRYAGAKKVIVELYARAGWVFLEICDNGVGFDLEKARMSGGMGLNSMEQRARQLGGRLAINSSPGAGTTISVEIPALERWVETTIP